MESDRRDFLTFAAGAVAGLMLPTQGLARNRAGGGVRAVACDAFVIFDPRPVVAAADEVFPGKGGDLCRLWRLRQFEYQWLHALGGHYVDFEQATTDALTFAAAELRLPLSTDQRSMLVRGFSRLHAWPDVVAALAAMRSAGIPVALLSNMTAPMLGANLACAGLDGAFAHVLSTDSIRTFKPDPRAYRLAVDAFALPAEEIAYAAFAGWDAAGASWFRHPTFWVDRLGQTREELGAAIDATGPGARELVEFVRSRR